jgi:predicted anti-sigma-YlaC factor YlaD
MHPVENEELISRYIDGELSGEEQEVLKGHLEGCPGCREELQALEEVVAIFSGIPLLSPRPGFTERVMARLAQREASRRVWKAMPALMGASLLLAIFASLPLIEFGDQIRVALAEFPLLLNLGMNLAGELLAILSSWGRACWLIAEALSKALDPRVILLQSILAFGSVALWIRLVVPLARQKKMQNSI